MVESSGVATRQSRADSAECLIRLVSPPTPTPTPTPTQIRTRLPVPSRRDVPCTQLEPDPSSSLQTRREHSTNRSPLPRTKSHKVSLQTAKVRTPSLGHATHHKAARTGVGWVKRAALGIVKRFAESVLDRDPIRTAQRRRRRHQSGLYADDGDDSAAKRQRGTPPPRSRKIDESEFPNVGLLRDATRSRGVIPVAQTTFETPAANAATPTAVARHRVQKKPRVSFPTPSGGALKVINRPRPIPRRRKANRVASTQCTLVVESIKDSRKEQDEWIDDPTEPSQVLIDRPLRCQSGSRLSLSSAALRLPFQRSSHFAPLSPRPRPPPRPLASPRSVRSSFSFPTQHLDDSNGSLLSPDRPSDESFQCRGEGPWTPTRAVYVPSSFVRDCAGVNDERPAASSRSPVADIVPGRLLFEGDKSFRATKREASISPGDLTMFLEDLVLEQAELRPEAVPRHFERVRLASARAGDDIDAFADADEPLRAGELATEERTLVYPQVELSRVPLARRSSTAPVEGLGAARPSSSSNAWPSTARRRERDDLDGDGCDEDDRGSDGGYQFEDAMSNVETAQVLSASRERFERGRAVVHKGSLSSLCAFGRLQSRPSSPLLKQGPDHLPFASVDDEEERSESVGGLVKGREARGVSLAAKDGARSRAVDRSRSPSLRCPLRHPPHHRLEVTPRPKAQDPSDPWPQPPVDETTSVFESSVVPPLDLARLGPGGPRKRFVDNADPSSLSPLDRLGIVDEENEGGKGRQADGSDECFVTAPSTPYALPPRPKPSSLASKLSSSGVLSQHFDRQTRLRDHEPPRTPLGLLSEPLSRGVRPEPGPSMTTSTTTRREGSAAASTTVSLDDRQGSSKTAATTRSKSRGRRKRREAMSPLDIYEDVGEPDAAMYGTELEHC